MPNRYAYLKMGERDIENAMPWDKLKQQLIQLRINLIIMMLPLQTVK